MKITRVELVPFALHFKRPYVTARGTLQRREMVLAKLLTDQDLVGLGEAVPVTLRGGELGAVLGDLERLRGVLEEADASPAKIPSLLERCASLNPGTPAMAAVDMALLDLSAKHAGRPAWELHGATKVQPVRCNATLVAGAPQEVAADAADWASHGFNTFKLKVGARDDDAAGVAAVRDAIGPEAKIRIDANGAWSTEQAIDWLARLEQHGIELAEQPTATLHQLALVRAATDVALAADESVASEQDAGRAVQLQACDYVTVKLAKTGGSVRTRNIAATLPTYLSSALDGPVGIAAAAHLAQVMPDIGLAHGLATQALFAEWPVRAGARLEGDMLLPSDAPGLGVELDEQALSDFRLDVS
ncbi:MAG: mandelate racemase/muconate lactonizing enzyme family protein [Solirubrobacterales bacterium]